MRWDGQEDQMNRATLVTLGCSIHNRGESPSWEMFRVFQRPFSSLSHQNRSKINILFRISLNGFEGEARFWQDNITLTTGYE